MSLPLRAATTAEDRELVAGDGYRLRYRRWSPSGPPLGTVVILNGIMSHSGWVFPLADAIVEAGYRFVGADRRGSGANEAARGDAPSAAIVIDDARRIVEAEMVAERPLVLVGWCWGAVLGLNLLRPLDGRVHRFVMIAPGLHPTAEVRDAAHRLDAAGIGAAEDAPVIGMPISDEMFTAGPYLDAFIRPDARRLQHLTPRYRAIMDKLAFGAVGALRRLRVPTRVLLATDDPATDNAATRAAVTKSPEGVVSIVEVASGHGMQFDVPDVVVAQILGDDDDADATTSSSSA